MALDGKWDVVPMMYFLQLQLVSKVNCHDAFCETYPGQIWHYVVLLHENISK
jgi:hypothetical protein